MSVAKRLQREVKANPAKAAGLGALLLVACWFWAPLVMGIFKSEEASVAPQAPVPLAPGANSSTAAPTLMPAGQAVANDAPPYDWRKYSKAIDEDAKMSPGRELSAESDPFNEPPAAEPPEAKPPVEVAPVVVQPITPADVGLELTTTLLGARRKIAEIGGKSYTVGDVVETGQEGASATFRVVEIHPRRVVLESEGKKYELRIPRPLVDSVAEQPQGNPPSDSHELPHATDTQQRKTSDPIPESDDPGSATN
jgi:hypothetical protein